jgi:hypothetical protein
VQHQQEEDHRCNTIRNWNICFLLACVTRSTLKIFRNIYSFLFDDDDVFNALYLSFIVRSLHISSLFMSVLCSWSLVFTRGLNFQVSCFMLKVHPFLLYPSTYQCSLD